jgi:hypothetical protein
MEIIDLTSSSSRQSSPLNEANSTGETNKNGKRCSRCHQKRPSSNFIRCSIGSNCTALSTAENSESVVKGPSICVSCRANVCEYSKTIVKR